MSATTERTQQAQHAHDTGEAPELRPWLTQADRAGRHAVARGSGKRRPLAVSLQIDLDAAQSAWLRHEARRSGRDYGAIVKELLDRERASRP
jgi:hypothetical protein